MGIAHNSRIVKFAGMIFEPFDSKMGLSIKKINLLILSMPHVAYEYEYIDTVLEDEKKSYIYNGWEYVGQQNYEPSESKSEQCIWGSKWTKNNKEVLVINSSPYESTGEWDPVIVSNEKENILSFCQDNNVDLKQIEENAIVKRYY